MVLQVEEARFRALGQRAGGGALGQLDVVMDYHAVVADGGTGVGGLLAVLVKLGRGEVDVVCLPLQRRKAHVHIRISDRVNAAALVVFAGEAK